MLNVLDLYCEIIKIKEPIGISSVDGNKVYEAEILFTIG